MERADLERHFRPAAAEGADGDGREQDAGRVNRGDTDVGDGARAQIAAGLLQRLEARIDLAAFAIEDMRLVGRDETPAHAAKKLETQLILGVLQRLAERRL